MFEFQKPNRPVTKVYIHCSASDNPDHDNVAIMDAWHKARGWSGVGYHLFIRKDGQLEMGRNLEKTPAAQRGHNRGSIAICLHGLVESEFTNSQKQCLIDVCCQINRAYDGRVTFHGHCEVANKTCPVIDYKDILFLNPQGNLGIKPSGKAVRKVESPQLSYDTEDQTPLLRFGQKGLWQIRDLQKRLISLGYHCGVVDGDFGKLTRAAVLAFQADNYLIEDGIVGAATYEALSEALPREIGEARTNKTVVGLAVDGSRIAQASMAQGLIGTSFTVGGVLEVLEENTGMVSRLAQSFGVYEEVLKSLGPWLGAVVVVGGIIVLLQAVKSGRARRDDTRIAKTL